MGNNNNLIVKNTNSFSLCKNCGHTRDWHHTSDLFFSTLFGVKLGDCTHYTTDESLPFWKNRRTYCNCTVFEPKVTPAEIKQNKVKYASCVNSWATNSPIKPIISSELMDSLELVYLDGVFNPQEDEAREQLWAISEGLAD